MGYSVALKESQIKKILPSMIRSIREVSDETGVFDQTLRNWLRKHGLYSPHLTEYEQELRDMVEHKNHDEKMEHTRILAENKRLKKELTRKEKALAEMAALYTRKKSRGTLGGQGGRLMPQEKGIKAVELVIEANNSGARLWKACETLAISISSFHRWCHGIIRIIAKVLQNVFPES